MLLLDRRGAVHRFLLLLEKFNIDTIIYRLSLTRPVKEKRVILVHGESDDTVPFEDAQILSRRLQVPLRVVPQGDHRLNCLVDTDRLQNLVWEAYHGSSVLESNIEL
eukprot:gb/GECH01010111.1/.p1 GENE.gb/GECH01010111.1/~~gb/GECH01010111.1/.p1  ORF type:complete len:107 (+),score=22.74 gb/GECH01010111.1/:1-321(+)